MSKKEKTIDSKKTQALDEAISGLFFLMKSLIS